MLNFDRLTTPAGHGSTLVEPGPGEMARALLANRTHLDGLNLTLGGVNLRSYRQRVRRDLVGGTAGPVVGIGHQPEFIHPGVWAKNVVAHRLATAVGGEVIHLVVDSDVPRDAMLHVPVVDGGHLDVRSLCVNRVPAGTSYEDYPSLDRPAVDRFGDELASAMGARFGESLLPRFLEGVVEARRPAGWVDQTIAGRRAIERSFAVTVRDHRVSRVWLGPLLAEIICNAHRFAACYNWALADYRRRYRVRSPQRPIPDLIVDGPRCELAVWVQEASGRRQRAFVERCGDTVRLFAGEHKLASWSANRMQCWQHIQDSLEDLKGWRFRPRALTLTLWARLCACDLFIHGIGGAKYDRITDRLIEIYFGVAPPAMACVSATLWLDLPHPDVTAEQVRAAQQRLRSVRFNPQRHLPYEADLARLIDARADAVERAARLRRVDGSNGPDRRRLFQTIRALSAQMLERRPDVLRDVENQVDRLRQGRLETQIARRRDYFFGLYRPDELGELLNRLPAVEAFRV